MSTTYTRQPDVQPLGDPEPRPVSKWTPGRIVLTTTAAVLLVSAATMAAAAGGVHLVDAQRRQGDYLTTDTTRVSSDGFAVTVEEIDLDGLSGDWLMGTARLRATGAEADSPVFVGLASTADVRAYLDDVSHSNVTDIDGSVTYVERDGGPPAASPGTLDIWTAQSSGPGTQTLTWEPKGGNWAVVVMNQDGSPGVDVTADVGATAPILARLVSWLVSASLLTAAAGLLVLLILRGTFRRASTRPA